MGGGVSETIYPFDYPPKAHQRRHGPFGYVSYESYRDWLRDEFNFRCVICLNREQWGNASGLWEIDHFVPQSQDTKVAHDYDNLLYLCRTCNAIKSD